MPRLNTRAAMPFEPRLLVLPLLFALSGCAAIGSSRGPTGSELRAAFAETQAAQERTAGAGSEDGSAGVHLFDGDDGARLRFSEAAGLLDGAEVVLFGEIHGHPEGLMLAADMYEAMLEVDGALGRRPRALALEFIERDDAEALAGYMATGDLAAWDEATEGAAGRLPEAHRRMIDLAREAGAPVVAANAPRRLVRLSRTDGYGAIRSLPPEERALVDLPAAEAKRSERRRFFELMGGGGGGASEKGGGMDIESFYRAQRVWDATMAESVAQLLREGHRVALVVGRFHAYDRAGVVHELNARTQASSATLLIEPNGLSVWQPTHRGTGDVYAYVPATE